MLCYNSIGPCYIFVPIKINITEINNPKISALHQTSTIFIYYNTLLHIIQTIIKLSVVTGHIAVSVFILFNK